MPSAWQTLAAGHSLGAEADMHAVRSFKITKLVESYSPEAQPLGHHMRDMLPVYAHVAAVLRGKAARLLAEDLQSGSADDGDEGGLHHAMTA